MITTKKELALLLFMLGLLLFLVDVLVLLKTDLELLPIVLTIASAAGIVSGVGIMYDELD